MIQGKVALVTGASRGIGRETALKLAEAGVDVAVHYVGHAEHAREVCDAIRDRGPRAIAVQADIADRAAVNRMVQEATSGLGPIDLLVNNAGEMGGVAFDALTPEHWDRIIAVNLTGCFNVLWAVKDGMIARKFGRVVNVASIAALAVRPQILPYAAAKAGIISLTKSCCEPLAPYNIRINCVAPGVTDTEMIREDQAGIQQLVQATPLGRLAQPEEMANVIVFLLSEEASYMTGSTVVVSGGRMLVP